MGRNASTDPRTAAASRRMRAYTRMYWEKEVPVLRTFGLRDGMSVVELGSGPGIVTDLLLDRFPEIAITGVDFREEVVEQARAYLSGRGRKGFRVVHADAQDTGLPEDTFDFAYARLVFRYLPDPLEAVREALRILKPGGTLAISDVDHDLWGTFHPPIPELTPVLDAFGRRLRERGGDARIGRRLPGLLTTGGFVRPQMETVATTSHDLPEGLEMETFLAPIGLARQARLVKGGWLSEAEAERARLAWNRFLASPSPFVLKVMLTASGEKSPG
ncbi:MAG: class I SAM-dependent methyltransferase [Thermoplasmata archaeon]